MPTDTKTPEPTTPPKGNGAIDKVVDRINSAENVLVALSNNPSVDEMSAAIALSLMLDRLGKHATAIYSGATPNALEFLQPENTFESNTDSLQDFIIALNKEKADHLRYKLDGEFVKVYITPYRTKITESDLEFSHGDYNVDLIIALNVKSGDDLDVALAEYRRILHDATAVNITTEAAGRFAEVEWSDSAASSVSEMVVQLSSRLGLENLEQDVATALLTGIIAATDRFSNERTQPSTMSAASQLMAAGADQQLISTNIEKTGFVAAPEPTPVEPTPVDDTLRPDTEIDLKPEQPSQSVSQNGPTVLQPLSPVAPVESAPVATPESNPAALAAPALDAIPEPSALPSLQFSTPVDQPAAPVTAPIAPADPGPVPTPAAPAVPAASEAEPIDPDAPKDYAKMMEEELAQPLPIELERMQQAQAAQATDPTQAVDSTQDANPTVTPEPTPEASPLDNVTPVDPLTPAATPAQPLEEAIQPIAPMPAEAQLPPPPAPPVNLDASGLPLPPDAENPTPVASTTPVAPAVPENPAAPQPTPVDPSQPTDPGAFQIPTIS